MRLLDPPLPPLHLKDSVVRELLIAAVGFLPRPPLLRGHGAQHVAQPVSVWQPHATRACALEQHGSRWGGGLLDQSRRCSRARQDPGVASTGTMYSARIEWPILQGRGSTGMELGPAGRWAMHVAHWHHRLDSSHHPPPTCARCHEILWSDLLLARRTRIPSRPERNKRALAFGMSGAPCRTPLPHSYNVASLEWLAPRKCSFISLAETPHPWLSCSNIACRGRGAARSQVWPRARLFRSGRTPSSGS